MGAALCFLICVILPVIFASEDVQLAHSETTTIAELDLGWSECEGGN
jgi:hypothetical protein